MRLRPPRSIALAIAGLALVAGPAEARDGVLRLPDLDQETPAQLDVMVAGAPGRPYFRLGFGSAVGTGGAGPPVGDGHRAGRRTPNMAGDQLIERQGGGQLRVRGGGRLSYGRAPTHQHWHLH